MDSRYYSKKLNRYFTRRLDVLIYAHDGRGLGHASRSIAIGLALRRLFPQFKTLFVSGCRQAAALIGNGTLDWVKLPSYATTIVKGRAEGGAGPSNFYKSVLGQLRGEMLASMVGIFQPRVVLVDHAPAGKRNELLPALEAAHKGDCRWILGLRGIIGDDPDIWSDAATQCFREFYESILWYGDSRVLGTATPGLIAQRFGIQPVEIGYVARILEIKHLLAPEDNPVAGTVSIPWGTEATWTFLDKIHGAIKAIGDGLGPWRLFVAQTQKGTVRERFRDLPFCRVEAVSERYIPSLINSRVAIVYGGYNSLSDVLALRTPAVVLLRDLRDREQRSHLDGLRTFTEPHLAVLPESGTDTATLRQVLERQLKAPPWHKQSLNMNGAGAAARTLAEGLDCQA